jgi:hypothetical protein
MENAQKDINERRRTAYVVCLGRRTQISMRTMLPAIDRSLDCGVKEGRLIDGQGQSQDAGGKIPTATQAAELAKVFNVPLETLLQTKEVANEGDQ